MGYYLYFSLVNAIQTIIANLLVCSVYIVSEGWVGTYFHPYLGLDSYLIKIFIKSTPFLNDVFVLYMPANRVLV